MKNDLVDNNFLIDTGIKIGIGAVFFIAGFTINRFNSKKSQIQIKEIIKSEIGEIKEMLNPDYNENAEVMGKIYIIHSILFSLRAIYRGGDSRMFPTIENRDIWLYQLKKCSQVLDNDQKDLDSLFHNIESKTFDNNGSYTSTFDFPDNTVSEITENKDIVEEIMEVVKKFPLPFILPFKPSK